MGSQFALQILKPSYEADGFALAGYVQEEDDDLYAKIQGICRKVRARRGIDAMKGLRGLRWCAQDYGDTH